AVRRKVVELVGGFDDRLDVGAAGCSGDSEFWYRVLAAGWSCAYTPAAVVYHRHRRQREQLRRQAYLYMRGHVAAPLVQFERHHHWGNLLHVCLELPAYYALTFAKALVRGFPVESRMLLRGIPGSLAGLRFYARGMSARRNAARAPGRSVAPAGWSSRIAWPASTPERSAVPVGALEGRVRWCPARERVGRVG